MRLWRILPDGEGRSPAGEKVMIRAFRHVDELAKWRELTCTYILPGEFTGVSRSFSASLSVNRCSDIQLSRIRLTGLQRFERTEKDVRQSSGEFFIVCLLLAGEGTLEQDNRQLLVRPGNLVCIDSIRPVLWRFSEDFGAFLVHLPRSVVASALLRTDHLTGVNLEPRFALAPILASFLRNLELQLDSLSQESTYRISEIVASLIIATLYEPSTPGSDQLSWSRRNLLDRAQEHVRAHSRNCELSPSAVAAELRISLRYLQELFQTTGQTARNYLLQCRLKNAADDLTNPILRSLNITEISLRAGFLDPSHFGKRFKEAYGTSPREFRMQSNLEKKTLIARRRTTARRWFRECGRAA